MSKEKSQRVVSVSTEAEAQKSALQEQSQGVSVRSPRVEGFHCAAQQGLVFSHQPETALYFTFLSILNGTFYCNYPVLT